MFTFFHIYRASCGAHMEGGSLIHADSCLFLYITSLVYRKDSGVWYYRNIPTILCINNNEIPSIH